MDVDQQIELEIRAQEMIADLEKEIAAQQEDRAAVEPDKGIGRISRLDAMQQVEVAKEQLRRKQRRLQALRDAIDRMDAGTYGTCLNCGKDIAYDRLHAAPELQLCGPCSAKR